MAAAVAAAKPATVAEAVKIAEAEAKKAVDEDMTGSLRASPRRRSTASPRHTMPSSRGAVIDIHRFTIDVPGRVAFRSLEASLS